MNQYVHISQGGERYHYVDSGLDNIWLIGGVESHETSYGPSTSIHDVDDFHRTIAMDIIASTNMNPQEIRFLQIELDLFQRALATLIGSDDGKVYRR